MKKFINYLILVCILTLTLTSSVGANSKEDEVVLEEAIDTVEEENNLSSEEVFNVLTNAEVELKSEFIEWLDKAGYEVIDLRGLSYDEFMSSGSVGVNFMLYVLEYTDNKYPIINAEFTQYDDYGFPTQMQFELVDDARIRLYRFITLNIDSYVLNTEYSILGLKFSIVNDYEGNGGHSC